MRELRSCLRLDRSGTAAAEMALVAPLLAGLMFGSLELGKFFWDEHMVVKAVRDGARYATRQSFASMPCGGPAVNLNQIRNVVRYGKPVVTVADKPLLFYWTNPATITVTIDCYANAGVAGARIYNGVYADRASVPRVTVSAAVPYRPLIGAIGFNSVGMTLHASSQATVFGL
jgi:hypothetical protein